MFKYETHCHTSPVSKCGKASVRDTVCFYKQLGYDGVFITNHFLDGNINPEVHGLSYRDQIDYYFSDFEKGEEIGSEIGIKVFPGVELSYKGTDFLIYGLEKEWYYSHLEILDMDKTDELAYMMEEGAFVIQAHPYREAHYIDHIRLFPRSVHGVEVINSSQSDQANAMAELYADQYGLLRTAGSDNHWGSGVFEKLREKGYRSEISGICCETEIISVKDYINGIRNGTAKIFLMDERGNARLVNRS